METSTAEGESPVRETDGVLRFRSLSSAEHEEFCVNRRGPSRKAKYYRETDSEPVP